MGKFKKGDRVLVLKDVKRAGFNKIEYLAGETLIIKGIDSYGYIWFKPDGNGAFNPIDFELYNELSISIGDGTTTTITSINYEIY